MIIDGKKEAQLFRDEIKKEIESIKSKSNKVPSLSVILIGDYAPSQIYVKNKEKNSREVGINSEVIKNKYLRATQLISAIKAVEKVTKNNELTKSNYYLLRTAHPIIQG